MMATLAGANGIDLYSMEHARGLGAALPKLINVVIR